MYQLPDHPIIRNMERTGYPGKVPEIPVCPVCGDEAETFYMNEDKQIVGCDNCIEKRDSWEVRQDG